MRSQYATWKWLHQMRSMRSRKPAGLFSIQLRFGWVVLGDKGLFWFTVPLTSLYITTTKCNYRFMISVYSTWDRPELWLEAQKSSWLHISLRSYCALLEEFFYITSNYANGKTSSSYYTILGPHSDVYIYIYIYDRACGLVVRVSGYRYRGLGFDSRRYQIF